MRTTQTNENRVKELCKRKGVTAEPTQFIAITNNHQQESQWKYITKIPSPPQLYKKLEYARKILGVQNYKSNADRSSKCIVNMPKICTIQN